MEETASLIIRKAEAGDTAAIHRVFVTAIRGIGSQFYTDEQKKAWEEAVTPDSWSTRIIEIQFYVGCLADEVVAFVSWYGSELVHIYVAEHAENRGIGTKLLVFALENMKHAGVTLTASLNAAEFYKAHGFVEKEMLAKERGGVPIPCIRMKRPLVYH